ncbi:hypothetical protein [Paramuribaculum intestinale]|uniref:hypothetical protein n=1 Tax=Paramuribaculum intestinale TaxID=2094151 RepID=UPI0025B58844|nr:hypothetical protein [Paramuribaculum intestinale]
MFTSKFYVDTKRNNALMVRIINNRKKVELSMGFQMDEETLANAMSDKPKPKNLRYKSLLSHWQAIIEDLKIFSNKSIIYRLADATGVLI